MPQRISRSTRRLIALLAALPAAVLFLGLLYMIGMIYLEGSPRGFWASLEWASETLTTTGYGADARWNHPLMTLFVMLTQFMGMFLVFLIFPIYVLPYFEERFESRLPRALPPMAERVLFYGYGPAIDSLLEEFQQVSSAFVIFEEDVALARNLRDRGYQVVSGKLDEDPDVLAGVNQARAIVANADDHANAICILIAREQGFEGPIYALANDPLYRAPMLQVGASAVYTPTHVLGAALAARASARISPPAEGLHLLSAQVGLAEFRVRTDSPLAGQRLGDLHLRERHGVTVIGQWRGGNFTVPKGPDTRIEPGAILVVVGAHANLTQVEHLAAPIRRTGPIVVAGYGTVGGKVVEMLRDAHELTVVIDEQLVPGVDIVGNVLEHATLARANVRAASAVVLALNNDSEGVFATAVVRDYAPEVPLIVRVNRAPNVKGKTAARRVARAHVLLRAAEGTTDEDIAKTLHLGRASVHRIRQRFVDEGLTAALSERPRSGAPPALTGQQAAFLVALAGTTPPPGRHRWTVQLLADRFIELRQIDTISADTVHRVLKKTISNRGSAKNSAFRVSVPTLFGIWKRSWIWMLNPMIPGIPQCVLTKAPSS